MAFDFDGFINKPCMRIFGHRATYIPLDEAKSPFQVTVDFHKAYEKVELQVGNVPITSTEITAFIRDAEAAPLQGDHLRIYDKLCQIIDVKEHIPGSKALILHEAS